MYWRLLQLTDELTNLADAVAKTQRSEEEEEQLRRVPERESLHRISEPSESAVVKLKLHSMSVWFWGNVLIWFLVGLPCLEI